MKHSGFRAKGLTLRHKGKQEYNKNKKYNEHNLFFVFLVFNLIGTDANKFYLLTI